MERRRVSPMPDRKWRTGGLAALVGLAVLTTAAATVVFSQVLAANGWDVIDYPLVALFAVLYFWISVGFWTATFGFVWTLRHRQTAASGRGFSRLTGSARRRIAPDRNRHADLQRGPVAGDGQPPAPSARRWSRPAIPGNSTFLSSATPAIPTSGPKRSGPGPRRAGSQWTGSTCTIAAATTTFDRKSGNIREFCERWAPAIAT